MKTNPTSAFPKRPVVTGCVVSFLFLLLTVIFAYQRYLLYNAAQTQDLNRAALDSREKLETALNYSLSATKTLSFLVTRYGVDRDFDSVARQIIESNKFIDALELVEGGVITHIYPLEGNEKAIGYNILTDSLRKREALLAKNSNELFFAGPIDLKQGYPAVVGRLPIYKGDKFWGFAASIIKLSTFIEAAEMDRAHNRRFSYQLSKVDPNTGREIFFLPHPELFQNGGAVVRVKVPKGNWTIYVRTEDSRLFLSLLPIIILGLSLSVTGGFLAWNVSRQPFKLKKLVLDKTEELRKSEEKYFSFFEQASDAIWLSDDQGNILEVNNNLCQLLGYSKTELLQIKLAELLEGLSLQPASGSGPQGGLADLLMGEKLMKRKEGTTVAVELNSKRVDGDRALTIARDVTEWRQAQRQIALSESTLRSAFDHSAIGMGLVSTEGKWLRVNQALCLLLGYSEKEMLSRNFQEMTFPDDLQKDIEYMQAVFKGERDSRKTQKRYLRKSGAVIWVSLNVSVVRDPAGKPQFFVVQIEDITEKRESEMKFRNLVEKSLVGVYIVQNGKFAYVNPRFAEIYGYAVNELINTIPAEEVVAEEDRDLTREKIRQRISGEKHSLHYQARGKRKDGTKLYVEAYGSSFLYRGMPAVIGSVLDITERKKAESDLIRKNAEIKERVKELTCLYHLSEIAARSEKEMGEILRDCVAIIPPAYQYPEITCAHIEFAGQHFYSGHFVETDWRQQATISVQQQVLGRVEVIYNAERPTAQEGPFLEEERFLIDSIARILGSAAERRMAEQEVKKLNRLYKFISEINSSVLKLDNGEAIYQEACRIAVEHGQFRMAWIGRYDEQQGEIFVVASAGHVDGYLQKVRITAREDLPEGMGPSGRAARSGRYYYCNDIANDPVMRPWREEALKRNYRSSISFPIVVSGHVKGIYTLYMPEPDFFTEAERNLLQDVTDNIAFALDKIRISAMHRVATAELLESEEKFRSLVEQGLVGVFILQNEQFIYMNPGFRSMTGYDEEKEKHYLKLASLIHEEDQFKFMPGNTPLEEYKNYKLQDIVRAIRYDGALIHLEVIATAIIYHNRLAIIGTAIDITDRLAEEKRISKAVTEAQENERIQIGMELHDNVNQLLAASLLRLDYLLLPDANTVNKEAGVRELRSFIREAIDELRRISHQLAPSVDSSVPIREKVLDLVAAINVEKKVEVELDLDEISLPLGTAVQLAIYRIIQEQFSNILKHADAGRVYIGMKKRIGSLRLIIRDDGRGFDTSVRKSGIGLVNIQRRAGMLNGQVKITSSPGNGCEVEVRIPFQ